MHRFISTAATICVVAAVSLAGSAGEADAADSSLQRWNSSEMVNPAVTSAIGSSGEPEKIPGDCTREIPVLFVHGFLMNGDNSFVALQGALAENGWCTYSFTYGAVGGNIPFAGFGTQKDGAVELAAAVENVRKETGAHLVHLVTHSKGAAVAAEYLAQNPDGHERVVNIAGVVGTLPFSDPVPAPRDSVKYLNIASRWDLVVPNYVSLPESCSTCSNELTDEPVGHVGLLYSNKVSARVQEFLSAE